MNLQEMDFDDAWDKQIAEDARVGRMDQLWEPALADIKARKTRPLDEVINET